MHSKQLQQESPCCSYLTGAVMTGIVSLTSYIMGFSLEVWWIVVAEEQLPIPAFLLCLIYLVLSALSLIMLIGLRSQRTYFLLSWISMVLILLFPEAGMVFFMALYHWKKNTNGILELVLWIVRFCFNICGMVCAHSLYASWKNEKSIMKSLNELSLNNKSCFSSNLPQSIVVHSAANKLGYPNPAYTSSIPSHINSTMSVTKYTNKPLKRSVSSASQFVSASRIHNDHAYPHSPQQYAFHQTQHLYNHAATRRAHTPSSAGGLLRQSPPRHSSSTDLPSFGLHPDDPVFVGRNNCSPHHHPVSLFMSHNMTWHRPRSLMDLGGVRCCGSNHCWNAVPFHPGCPAGVERHLSFSSRDKKSYSTGSLNQDTPPSWRTPSSQPRFYPYSEDDSDIEDDEELPGVKPEGNFSRGSSDHIDEYRDVAL